MPTTWREVVLDGLRRYTLRNRTSKIARSPFLEQELPSMASAAGSTGKTPAQTVSRVLQELRDEGKLFFSSGGVYVLTDQAVDLTREELADDIVENAIIRDALLVPDVPVGIEVGAARLRRGQDALRRLTLANYRGRCALCDTRDPRLLVTSHVARWADRSDARGKLSNTICFCALHDRLFEHGYFAVEDDLRLIVRANAGGVAIQIWLDRCTTEFQRPTSHRPRVEFLREHRWRVGLTSAGTDTRPD